MDYTRILPQRRAFQRRTGQEKGISGRYGEERKGGGQKEAKILPGEFF